jgi:hypothetical protein
MHGVLCILHEASTGQRTTRNHTVRKTAHRITHHLSKVLQRDLCIFFPLAGSTYLHEKHRIHVPLKWPVRVIFTGRWCAFTSSLISIHSTPYFCLP